MVPRLRAMLGKDRRFELEWISVYTFRCRRLARFRHGRVHLPRRRRARGLAVRRARLQLRHPGRRQPRLEARLRAARAWHPSACSTATTRSASSRPTTTSATRPARPSSSRPRTRRAAPIATPCWRSPSTTRSPAGCSTAAGCRRRPGSTSRRSTRPTRSASPAASARGRPAEDAPLAQGGAPCWLLDQLAAPRDSDDDLLLFLDARGGAERRLASALASWRASRCRSRPG